MKILNLILYSTDVPEYVQMKEILSKHLKRSKIEYYFYYYSPNQAEEFLLKDDMLSIKGTENDIPGILEKTLKAFEYFQNKDYDYVVRSNISAVIDFRELGGYLYSNPIDYGGPLYLKKSSNKSIDESTDKFEGYIGGVCVVLSKKIVKTLINNKLEILSYEVGDDVSIGMYLQNTITPFKISIGGIDGYILNSDRPIKGKIAYKHKSSSRQDDVNRMNVLVFQLWYNPK
jgi:hypothetical protein